MAGVPAHFPMERREIFYFERDYRLCSEKTIVKDLQGRPPILPRAQHADDQ
ncbi:hypothetical protein ABIA26_001205 [Sinorhizobium fredii]